MAFRDTWHRALVYFGLAEERDVDYDDDYDEPAPLPDPEPEQDSYRERPNVRRLSARRRRDEIDDIFADDDMPMSSERSTRTLRPVQGGRANGGRNDVRVHLVLPKKFNDSVPVILNLQGVETELSKRLIDFASGLTYALDGGMQRIADKVFLLTP